MKTLFCCMKCRWPWSISDGMEQIKECPKCKCENFLELGESPACIKLKKLMAVVTERFPEAYEKALLLQQQQAEEDAFRASYRWKVYLNFRSCPIFIGPNPDCYRIFEFFKRTLIGPIRIGILDQYDEMVQEEVVRSASLVTSVLPDDDPDFDHYDWNYDYELL